MSAQSPTDQVFPIGRVSELTGVNSVTLRAWERRYGLIRPARSSSGHRLYSDTDIELIQYVLEQLERGIPISGVARQLKEQNGGEDARTDNLALLRTRMSQAVQRFDEAALDTALTEAMSLFPASAVMDHLLVPLLGDTDARKESGSEGSVAEGNFYRVFLRNKLGARLHYSGHIEGAEGVVTACLPGELDDLSLLLFGLAVKTHGYNPIPLGKDTPLHEIPLVLERTKAAAVVLTGSGAGHCAERAMQISGLARMLSVPVFVSGTVAWTCLEAVKESGGIPLGPDFQAGIQTIRNALSNHARYTPENQ